MIQIIMYESAVLAFEGGFTLLFNDYMLGCEWWYLVYVEWEGGKQEGVSLTQQPAVAGRRPHKFYCGGIGYNILWRMVVTAKNPRCRSKINRSQWKGEWYATKQNGLSSLASPTCIPSYCRAETPNLKEIDFWWDAKKICKQNKKMKVIRKKYESLFNFLIVLPLVRSGFT